MLSHLLVLLSSFLFVDCRKILVALGFALSDTKSTLVIIFSRNKLARNVDESASSTDGRELILLSILFRVFLSRYEFQVCFLIIF